MTIPSDWARGELRYLDRATTFTTSFTAADNAAWAAGTATKLRYYDLDFSGLTEEVVADPAVQTRFDGRNAPIVTKKGGSFKFKMHLSGGSATTDATTLSNLMGACLGGLYSPAAISDAVEADSTATQIKATAHGLKNNQIVLVGARGDSGGGGKCSPIEDEDPNSDANAFDLQLALPAAPAAEAVIKAGHTIYLDETDESYLDFLFIGSHAGTGATNNPDSIQMIGCSGKCSIGGLKAGEIPFVEFEFFVGDCQWVNYDDQASFSHSTAVSGGDPINSAAEGQLIIQDTATTTRNTIKGGDFTVDFGYDLVPIMDKNCPNDIGGWRKVRAESGAQIGLKAYWSNLADMPGLYNDLSAGTAKQVLLQIGNTAQATMCLYMQNAHIRGPIDPAHRVEYERNTALDLLFEGSGNNATTLSSAEDRLEDAGLVCCFL